ncbi:hypothetical protein ACTMU2_36610 [Cupriavidus basilensis]
MKKLIAMCMLVTPLLATGAMASARHTRHNACNTRHAGTAGTGRQELCRHRPPRHPPRSSRR